MQRRVVVAAFGAAVLAPATWLATRREPPAPLPPVTADQRRAAGLLGAVRAPMLLTAALTGDTALAWVHALHAEQEAALARVAGRAAGIPPATSTAPPETAARELLMAAERQLTKQARSAAVDADAPEYAQLFAAVHASAAQILAVFARGLR